MDPSPHITPPRPAPPTTGPKTRPGGDLLLGAGRLQIHHLFAGSLRAAAVIGRVGSGGGQRASGVEGKGGLCELSNES